MSNLATVLTASPSLAEHLVVTQMGGALKYRDPSRAEHNMRLDPNAARTILRLAKEPLLVTSDVTFTADIEITVESPIYRFLTAAGSPEWARIIADHLDRWFTTFHPGTIQHDALTLSAALELPFVNCDVVRVAVDDIGRMREDHDGVPVLLSYSARYPAFLRWLSALVGPAVLQ